MKTALLITGLCAGFFLGGCTTESNVGSPGAEYESSSGAGVSTKGDYVPGNPTTDPRGGWYDWRYRGIEGSEGHQPLPPQPNQ